MDLCRILFSQELKLRKDLNDYNLHKMQIHMNKNLAISVNGGP